MLLQNPQLAYALLQAQVIMKIVDPKVADVSFCSVIRVGGDFDILKEQFYCSSF